MKPKPYQPTPEEIAQHKKALIENASWNGEHGREHKYYDPQLQAAYEAGKVLS